MSPFLFFLSVEKKKTERFQPTNQKNAKTAEKFGVSRRPGAGPSALVEMHQNPVILLTNALTRVDEGNRRGEPELEVTHQPIGRDPMNGPMGWFLKKPPKSLLFFGHTYYTYTQLIHVNMY